MQLDRWITILEKDGKGRRRVEMVENSLHLQDDPGMGPACQGFQAAAAASRGPRACAGAA